MSTRKSNYEDKELTSLGRRREFNCSILRRLCSNITVVGRGMDSGRILRQLSGPLFRDPNMQGLVQEVKDPFEMLPQLCTC